jgi:hypothetical protein
MPQIPAIWEMEIGKITEASLHQKKKKINNTFISTNNQDVVVQACNPSHAAGESRSEIMLLAKV